MAQTSNLKFLYHIVCMLITVMLLDSMELKTLCSFLQEMWRMAILVMFIQGPYSF